MSMFNLMQYLTAARPQVARMLGMQQSPQQRIDQGFGDAAAANPPMQDFNQSFGMSPFNNGADKAGFLSKYLQPQQPPAQAPPQDPQAPGAPMSLAPPNPGPASPPMPPGFSDDFMGRLAGMGAQSGAGLIPKFAYLAGLGRTGGGSGGFGGGPSGGLGGFY